MADVELARSRRENSGSSYVHEWNRFVAWSEAAFRRSLPATPRRRGGLS